MTDWSTSSLTARGSKPIIVDFFQTGTEKEWEINPGKADSDNEAYVSIESNNKPGLYMAAGNQGGGRNHPGGTGSGCRRHRGRANRMTFRTLYGMNGEGVTFESVQYPGYYMTSRDGALYLEQDPDPEAATFYVSTDSYVSMTMWMYRRPPDCTQQDRN